MTDKCHTPSPQWVSMTAPLTTDERLDVATELVEQAYDFLTQFELTRVMTMAQMGREVPNDPMFPKRWYAQAEALLLSR